MGSWLIGTLAGAGLLVLGSSIEVARADMAAAQAALDASDYAAAARELRPLTDAGDPQAQYQLAKLALDGRDVGLKPEEAMSLLVQSAAQGNGHAQARLGLAYARGDHVVQNDRAAFQWLSRASVSPDLSDTERAVVATNRRVMLDRLSPTLATGTSVDEAAALMMSPPPQPLPAPPSTPPEPVTSIGAVPYFGSKPLADPQAAETAAESTHQPTPAASKAVPAPAAASPAAATPAVASGTKSSGFVIQLASLPNESAAQSEEDRLRQKFVTVLDGLTLTRHVVDLGGKGVYHRILAGPFGSRADARSRCAQFRAAKQDCIVTAAQN